ncbi:MAG: hypothetical protein EBT83_14205 [Betaproteobacteria bacterium]|jgi:hypothetical protein|nr:hypothetical protein [Betaproteobacteria bacterium]
MPSKRANFGAPGASKGLVGGGGRSGFFGATVGATFGATAGFAAGASAPNPHGVIDMLNPKKTSGTAGGNLMGW